MGIASSDSEIDEHARQDIIPWNAPPHGVIEPKAEFRECISLFRGFAEPEYRLTVILRKAPLPAW